MFFLFVLVSVGLFSFFLSVFNAHFHNLVQFLQADFFKHRFFSNINRCRLQLKAQSFVNLLSRILCFFSIFSKFLSRLLFRPSKLIWRIFEGALFSLWIMCFTIDES